MSISYNVLNKPDSIVFGNGTAIKYIYKASGIRLSRKLYTNSVLETTTDYMGNGMYENDTLRFIGHSEGRVVMSGGDHQYQYAYTDHLGNVRMLISSAPETYTFKATMESESEEQADDALFSNITDNPVDTEATSYNQVQRLMPGNIAGAAITLPVYPGDTLSLSVQGFYRNGSGSGTAGLSALITAVAGAFGGLNGGSIGEQGIYDAFERVYDPGLGGGVHAPPSGYVAAYLNYILFDKNFNAVQVGFVAMDDDANGSAMPMQIPDFIVQHEGFVYAYLTNESNAEVYYDDFEVSLKESLVVQQTDYYPFGMQHASSWTRLTTLKNNFLYNAGSELNEETKNYETPFRGYDAATGRFTGIDPVAAKYASLTPYNYAFNDPVGYNDPSGADPIQDMLDNMGRSRRGYHGSYGSYYSYQMEMDGRGSWAVRPGSGNHWSNQFSDYTRDRILMSSINFDAKYSDLQVWNPWHGLMSMSDPETAIFLANKGDHPLVNLYFQQQRQEGLIGTKLPELFYGGKLYSDIAEGLEEMWKASFHPAFDKGRRENTALITDAGLLVLPNYKNGPKSGSGSFSLFWDKLSFTKDETGTYTIWAVHFEGSWLEVKGMVHTHPFSSSTQNHSSWEQAKGDWIGVFSGKDNYVISHSGIYQALPNLTSKPISRNNSKGYKKVGGLYGN